MGRYILKRLTLMLMTLLIVISVTFFLVRLLPGSPFNDEKLNAQQVEMINKQYGLDAPVPVQYVRYMTGVFTGDLGRSFKYDNKKVEDLISTRLKPSAMLGAQALMIGSVVGLTLGIVAALKKNTFWDYFATVISVLGVSVPSFVLAALLQLYLTTRHQIFPVTWGMPIGSDFRYAWTVLPSIALAFFSIASIARFTRTELVEVLNADYIVTAKSKGLTKAAVIVKHALRNALIPVVTMLGPLTVGLLTGSLVVEKVFAVPGLGDLLVSSITTNDLFCISGVSIFYSALYIGVILLVDILYGIIDPRIRVAGGKA
ncbi:peptide ABC transporter permease [Paraclostridium bifermentans]|uniref:Binding--dependent transport system inner membrane component family protein n=1 Tax=Paraclostridium bifermentans ATCC 638 = DSM 14991 TaxID=1233171 RepID=T4VJW8_PARBF|nr:ABC transporter permease [Paraclostridium bifermentans]EQK41415.1 binding--dependent transport system inner membrane component family protein [[Clostridium] bifermentans ATCC 638] [Paraclostridium bifermentans ATCC 638 = DSM 14991]MCE9676131.1 ABC transporter permease [Paraclostridium bifermentans]MCR1876552.1 ABC transporter permease [Paraclostridium bifermentans]RIZ59096.1 ABC transporter permease [Paraclostridium bifermentans]UAG18387.1 ABC transporter permease [Paraclostridium biferment